MSQGAIPNKKCLELTSDNFKLSIQGDISRIELVQLEIEGLNQSGSLVYTIPARDGDGRSIELKVKRFDPNPQGPTNRTPSPVREVSRYLFPDETERDKEE